MKYLCLIYNDETKLDAMSTADFDAFCGEHIAYEDELRKDGQLIVAEPLESVQTATTVRVRSEKVSITDGPFTETSEQLGGIFLIDARDLNDAIRIASKIPSARLGTIEVRPVRELTEGQRSASLRREIA
ncbi:MAG: YciI family protein [Longimicrobiales bacterium]